VETVRISSSQALPNFHVGSRPTRVADSNSRKRGQFFIRVHNETLPITAMRVSNAHVRSRDET
jgi:hypothetical protein